MEKKLLLLATLSFGLMSKAQVTATGVYLIGDFVEVGINTTGHEGAPLLAGSHNRCTSCVTDMYFGFVADPEETGWVDYNGDFFTPGSPENGFGVSYGGTHYMANGQGISGSNVPFSDSSFVDYVETTDSVYVTWIGHGGDLELHVKYILRKDEHFFTTELTFINNGAGPLTDVYYYRNLDPDNNQSIGGGFATSNVIVSQADGSGTAAEVTAFQETPWYSEFTFVSPSDDVNWKAYKGGFTNRNGSDIWNGLVGGTDETVGDTVFTDAAIGIAYKISSLPTGKAAPFTTSFITRFKPGATSTLGSEEFISPLSVYPTATSTSFQVNLRGNFDYFLIDVNGRIVREGFGTDNETVDISDLPNGMYFLKARTDKAYHTAKIIKQ